MEVLSTTLASDSTDVTRDVNITIEFDKEVRDTSIDDVNFVLYIFDGTAYTGNHPIIVNKDTTDVEKLTISPSGDLAASTKFTLLIKGDMNLSDAILQGIVAVDEDTMDGNYTLSFTTGESYSDPDETEPVDHTLELELCVAPDGTTYNSVVSTTPYNGQANVNTLAEIIVNFNTPLASSQDTDVLVEVEVESVDWPYDNVPEEYEASGFILPSGILSNSNKRVTYNIDSSDQSLSSNSLFILTIPKEEVTGASGYLRTDYTWFFTSNYDPAYAHPRQVRSHTGNVFSDIPDSTIWYLIHQNSEYLMSSLGISYTDNSDVSYDVNRWVICKTAMDLYNVLSGSSAGYGTIIQKTLGDISIKYDNSSDSSSAVPDWIRDCVESLWAKLGGSTRPQVGIKSYATSKYPGRRRSTI